MDFFKLLKAWHEFSADTKDITPTHTALFFFCLDLNNRLAWKEVFGLPTLETSEYLNISPNTLRKALNDLVRLNIIKMVKKSKNQFSANQISMGLAYQNLLKLSKGNYLAFVKAQQKQLSSNCAIDIHNNNNTSIHNNIKEEEQIKNLPERKVKKYDFTEFGDFANKCTPIVKLFPEEIVKNLTDKQKYEWIKTLKMLTTKEKISIDEIYRVVDFTRNDSFWAKNFLTIEKLRKTNSDGVKYFFVFRENMQKREKQTGSRYNPHNKATCADMARTLEKEGVTSGLYDLPM